MESEGGTLDVRIARRVYDRNILRIFWMNRRVGAWIMKWNIFWLAGKVTRENLEAVANKLSAAEICAELSVSADQQYQTG